MNGWYAKMERDLITRGLRPSTRARYLDWAKKFAKHHRRSPMHLGGDDISAWLAHIVSDGSVCPGSLAGRRAALDFLYRYTLGRPGEMAAVPQPRRGSAPKGATLSRSEMARLLDNAPCAFARTLFSTAYAAGLRMTEVCHLQAVDILSRDRLINVRHTKGGEPRLVMLSDKLLDELRAHWRRFGLPGPWVFPARRSPAPLDGPAWSDHPVGAQTVGEWFRVAAYAAELRGHVTFHALRRSFATHMLDDGIDSRIIQEALGHKHITTTQAYTRVHPDLMARTTSPLDTLRKRR